MPRLLRILLFIAGALLILGYIGLRVMKKQTKRHSPADTVTVVQGDLVMSVKYCRPFRKGRNIFGELVPYDQVWRTGANEATTFTTNATISFGGTEVDPGTYTLWSIPTPTEWKVILNEKRYGWGVTWGGEASRQANFDVAKVAVPVQVPGERAEQFTIRFREDPLALVLHWDDVLVEVPITQ
jgi:hypothetical protein